MFRMASLSIVVEFEEQVSKVQRISGVEVMDGSSLTGMAVGVCAIVLVLTVGLGLFVQRWIVVVFAFVVVLFHRWYRKPSWSLFFAYIGVEEGGTGCVQSAVLERKNSSYLSLACSVNVMIELAVRMAIFCLCVAWIVMGLSSSSAYENTSFTSTVYTLLYISIIKLGL